MPARAFRLPVRCGEWVRLASPASSNRTDTASTVPKSSFMAAWKRRVCSGAASAGLTGTGGMLARVLYSLVRAWRASSRWLSA